MVALLHCGKAECESGRRRFQSGGFCCAGECGFDRQVCEYCEPRGRLYCEEIRRQGGYWLGNIGRCIHIESAQCRVRNSHTVRQPRIRQSLAYDHGPGRYDQRLRRCQQTMGISERSKQRRPVAGSMQSTTGSIQNPDDLSETGVAWTGEKCRNLVECGIAAVDACRYAVAEWAQSECIFAFDDTGWSEDVGCIVWSASSDWCCGSTPALPLQGGRWERRSDNNTRSGRRDRSARPGN